MLWLNVKMLIRTRASLRPGQNRKQKLKDTHTVTNAAASDTVKVNKCLLAGTVKTGERWDS